jgi:sentrin-specific protease 1
MDQIKGAIGHLNQMQSLFIESKSRNRFDYIVNKRFSDHLLEIYHFHSCNSRYINVNIVTYLKSVMASSQLRDIYLHNTPLVITELEKLLVNSNEIQQYYGLEYILFRIENETNLVFHDNESTEIVEQGEHLMEISYVSNLVIPRSYIKYRIPLLDCGHSYAVLPTPDVANRYAAPTDAENNFVLSALTLSGIEDNTQIEPILYPDIVVKKFDIPITKGNILRLLPGAWINDELINYYMKMLQQYSDSLNKNNYYFSSSFMDKLFEGNVYTYKNVERWSRHFNPLNTYDKIFFPINISNWHWVLICADRSTKTMTYFDSLFGESGHLYLSNILNYFKEHSYLQNDIWNLVDIPIDQPSQTNNCDCGIFTIMVADFLTDDLSISFIKEGDMNFFRRKICSSILAGKLPYSD